MANENKKPWLSASEKLLCFGDSITAEGYGYVDILQKALLKHNVQVVKCGLPGDKTPAALTRLHEVGEQHPDAVSIYFGANDAAIGHSIWRHEPQVSPENYCYNLQWIIYLLKLKYQIKKFTIITPYHSFEGESLEMYGDSLRDYCLMARQAADISDAVLVPLDVATARFAELNAVRRDPVSRLLFTRDGVHPTEEGHQLIADTLIKC